jgi:CheY-like chemotaxis protein
MALPGGEGVLSPAERHADFLAQRLRAFGLQVSLARGATSAEGVLPVGTTPFETLGRPLVTERLRFYTLGHNRLKFSEPPVFFDLPALDVTRCESAHDIEAALRRSWAAVQRDLAEALIWLERLNAPTQLVAGGARLRFIDESGGTTEVRSPREILLPSSGALTERSLTNPGERRYRPLASLESANELALAIATAVRERAARSALVPPPSAPEDARPIEGKRARRVLAVTSAPEVFAQLAGHLSEHAVEVDVFRDATRALAAFREQSYELVFVDIHLGREDGFELAMRLRALPGVEQLPIALIDERESNASRSAARDAGAALYATKPLRWEELGETVLDLLDHAAYRRYQRFPARLAVRTAASAGNWDELTELVARGGICLRTRRDILPGAAERYRIHLPSPFAPVDVEGDVMSRATLPGYASVLAGIRFRRFLDGGEARWIRVIEALAERGGREPSSAP